MMTRVGIDPKWTSGSIRKAASSKALDDGLEPAYITAGVFVCVCVCVVLNLSFPGMSRLRDKHLGLLQKLAS